MGLEESEHSRVVVQSWRCISECSQLHPGMPKQNQTRQPYWAFLTCMAIKI